MTTLVSWAGVDSRGVASIYLASDSRITWGERDTWNYGKKLFYAKSSPEVFGFCGDVIFPAQVLDQLCEEIDAGGGFPSEFDFEGKLSIVHQRIASAFVNYPRLQRNEFEVFYISRMGAGMKSEFYAGRVYWEKGGDVEFEVMSVPSITSGLIKVAGSGVGALNNWSYKWGNSDVKGTSRSVFAALCSSIKSGEDKKTGGAPQLIGLYRTGAPKLFGIVWEGKRYLCGAELGMSQALSGIEWRNESFERYDPVKLELVDGAQRQPTPRKLAKL